MQELLVADTKTYKEMIRINYESFKEIFGFIEPYITPKESAVMGAQLITLPAKRLVLVIRFLVDVKLIAL